MAGYDGTTSVIARWVSLGDGRERGGRSGSGRRIAERERSNRALSLLYSTARRTSSAGGTDEFRWPGMLAPPAPSRAGSRSGGWTRTGREERIEKRVGRRSGVERISTIHAWTNAWYHGGAGGGVNRQSTDFVTSFVWRELPQVLRYTCDLSGIFGRPSAVRQRVAQFGVKSTSRSDLRPSLRTSN